MGSEAEVGPSPGAASPSGAGLCPGEAQHGGECRTEAEPPSGGKVAPPLCEPAAGRPAGRAAPRSPAPNYRRSCGTGADLDLGIHSPECDTLEHALPGAEMRDEPKPGQ